MLKQRVKHIFAHNFLNIPPIFNLQKVLESWDLDLSNHTIQYYVCQRGRKLIWLLTLQYASTNIALDGMFGKV